MAPGLAAGPCRPHPGSAPRLETSSCPSMQLGPHTPSWVVALWCLRDGLIKARVWRPWRASPQHAVLVFLSRTLSPLSLAEAGNSGSAGQPVQAAEVDSGEVSERLVRPFSPLPPPMRRLSCKTVAKT